MAEAAGKRLAVLVGCNYPDSGHELQGCINDALSMKDLLQNRFGFDPEHIQVLTDEAGSEMMPTGANIKKALEQMIGVAQNGDVLFFHYSGHGTLIPSLKADEPSRKDEAIVPCDFNLITDIDFRQLVNRLPSKSSFTMLSDSCHSGGLIDQEKEQIGPSATPAKGHRSRSKMIPLDLILQRLKRLTGIDTSNIGAHMKHQFKEDASLKFRFAEREGESDGLSDGAILLSGCQTNETSADVNGDEEEGGKPHGAFTYAVQTVLKEEGGVISNKELVLKARKVLMEQGFRQHPCLYCSDENGDSAFLLQPRPQEGSTIQL